MLFHRRPRPINKPNQSKPRFKLLYVWCLSSKCLQEITPPTILLERKKKLFLDCSQSERSACAGLVFFQGPFSRSRVCPRYLWSVRFQVNQFYFETYKTENPQLSTGMNSETSHHDTLTPTIAYTHYKHGFGLFLCVFIRTQYHSAICLLRPWHSLQCSQSDTLPDFGHWMGVIERVGYWYTYTHNLAKLVSNVITSLVSAFFPASVKDVLKTRHGTSILSGCTIGNFKQLFLAGAEYMLVLFYFSGA